MSGKNQSPIIIYENADKAVEVRLDADKETLWLTQAQMGVLFDVKPRNVIMHLKNIFAEGELTEAETCKDFLQVQSEGGRDVNRKRKHYSLDAVIIPDLVLSRNHRNMSWCCRMSVRTDNDLYVSTQTGETVQHFCFTDATKLAI